MILHFVFVVKQDDWPRRQKEFEYVEDMGRFFQRWIKSELDLDYEVRCDVMPVEHRSILQRLDTGTLIRDHEERGKDTYHFYLTYFRPLWTDCTCEGYHAENFGMVRWLEPKSQDDTLYLAEKNCTTVSHELLHELLRQKGHKKYVQMVHEVWTKHLFEQLEFKQYGDDYNRTDGKPKFLVMDTSTF